MKNSCIIPGILIAFALVSCKDRTARNVRVEKKYQANDSYLQHRVSSDEVIDTYNLVCDNEGYELAGQKFRNPLPATADQLNKGKRIYEGHCAHCHGTAGNADAPMILKNKFPPPPPYRIRFKTINEGKMFASVSCGKNFMPSFRNELNPDERWQVVMYIKTLVKP